MPLVLSCDCKAVRLAVSGEPAACAYCHCATCREFYDASVLAATAWPKDRLEVSLGGEKIAEYQHRRKQMRRYFCTRCGETMFGTNRLGMVVIRNSIAAKSRGGLLAPELHPKFHLFYGSREIDVKDGLPKYIEGRDGPLFSTQGSLPA